MQKFIINVLVGATLLAWSVQRSQASEMDKKTILTISGPVQIPGMVLQPGTYIVKRADPNSPNVIRFLNDDGTHVYATVMTIPVIRSTPSDKVEVTLAETRGVKPAALRTWFYPGDTTGQQFIYPRGGDVLTASMATTEVQGLAPEPAKESEPVTATMAESESQPISTSIESTPAPAERNVEIAQSTYSNPEPAAAPARQQTPAPPEEPNRLPSTAGFLPLLTVLGAGAIAGGAGLKAALRKHRS